MFDTLELAPTKTLITPDQAAELENTTRPLTFTDALRTAAQCQDLKQSVGSWGDAKTTACALSAGILVGRRTGWLA